jgi:hypothetical protein
MLPRPDGSPEKVNRAKLDLDQPSPVNLRMIERLPTSISYNGAANMEQETVEDRLDVAHRLFDALRAQLPGQSITLVDARGRVVASSDRQNSLLKPISN